jgi:hypothetical protein
MSRSHSSLKNRNNIPKTVWEASIYYNIIFCEKTAPECLTYAHTVPKLRQISAFLNSRTAGNSGFLKCVCMKVPIFSNILSSFGKAISFHQYLISKH